MLSINYSMHEASVREAQALMSALPPTQYGSFKLAGEGRRETEQRTSWAKIAVLLTAVTAFAGMAGVSFAAQMSATNDVADVEHSFAGRLAPSLRGAVAELSGKVEELSDILNARLEPTSEPITFEPLPREEEEGAVDEGDDAVELEGTPSFAEKQPPLPALPAASATAATATAAAGASQAQPTNVPQDKTRVSPPETVERRLSETANVLEPTTTEQPDGGIVNWPWSISGRRPPRRAAPAPT